MVATVQPSSEVEAWVGAFTDGWRAPTSVEAFTEHFERWLAPDVRLIQPMGRPLIGHAELKERFVRPLFELIGDLHGTVEGWAANDTHLFIELRLEGTLGSRAVTIRTCDRVELRDGVAIERLAYLDPTPLLTAIARSPRVWPRAIRQQLAAWRHN